MRSLLVVAVLGACGSVHDTADAPPGGGSDGSPAGGATLTLAKASRWVPQNGSVTVGFTVARDATSTPVGALTVHVNSLPAGVTVADVALGASETTGTLTFSASAAATLGMTQNASVDLSSATGTLVDQKPFLVEVSGAPGTLDTTFGTAGKVTFPLPDPVVAATSGNGNAAAIAQYPATAGANAGKIVVFAQLGTTGATSQTKKLALIRLNADGTTDTTFGGSTGYVLVDGSPADQFYAQAVALDSQGRIVVLAGRQASVCENTVHRYTATGAADTAFTVYSAGPPGGFCGTTAGLAILAGDKIEIMGVWNNSDGSQRPVLLQLAADGTPDTTAFTGGNYALRLPNPTTDKRTFAGKMMGIDAQGRLLIPGFRCEGGWDTTYSSCESALGRVTGTGAWDTTFGASNLGFSALTFGVTPSPPTTEVQAFFGMTQDAQNNIVVVGWNENKTTATLARFSGTTGAIDTTFGTSGRITPVLVTGGVGQELTDVAIDDEGRVVGAGFASSGGSLVVMTRYSSAGVIDATFGTAGVATTPSAGYSPKLIVQPDGRYIAAGATPRGAGIDTALWRFWP